MRRMRMPLGRSWLVTRRVMKSAVATVDPLALPPRRMAQDVRPEAPAQRRPVSLVAERRATRQRPRAANPRCRRRDGDCGGAQTSGHASDGAFSAVIVGRGRGRVVAAQMRLHRLDRAALRSVSVGCHPELRARTAEAWAPPVQRQQLRRLRSLPRTARLARRRPAPRARSPTRSRTRCPTRSLTRCPPGTQCATYRGPRCRTLWSCGTRGLRELSRG